MRLCQLHASLGHPGFARLCHFIPQRNLPYSSEETKTVCRSCRTCAEIKSPVQTLIKALQPWDRLSSAVSAQLWSPSKMLTEAPLLVTYKKNFRRYATSRGRLDSKQNIIIADTILAEPGR